METILKIIKQEEYDRYVFITYKKEKIVGLNFHQGIDDISYKYSNPCQNLTDIYNRLVEKKYLDFDSEIKIINKSIDLFMDAFIFQDDNRTNIPKTQLYLIKKALNYYVDQYEKFNENPNQEEAYEIFDINQLNAMMNYEISISISEEDKNNFALNHGMDFPIGKGYRD